MAWVWKVRSHPRSKVQGSLPHKAQLIARPFKNKDISSSNVFSLTDTVENHFLNVREIF